VTVNCAKYRDRQIDRYVELPGTVLESVCFHVGDNALVGDGQLRYEHIQHHNRHEHDEEE